MKQTISRKPSIASRLLLPSMLLVLLLPIGACLIFATTAERYSLRSAEQELTSLQQQVLPLIESTFVQQAMPQSKEEQKKQKQQEQEQAKAFLTELKTLLKNRHTDADMIIFNHRFEAVYPKATEPLSQLAALEHLLSEQIQNTEPQSTAPPNQLVTIEGNTYLTELVTIPSNANLRAKYLVAYCPVPEMKGWIASAAQLVLLITALLALCMMVVLALVARGVIHPIKRLCSEADRIGNGNFSPIDSSFSLREPEELRRAMNRMSKRLGRAESAQRDFFQNVSHELRTPLMSIGGYAQGIECGVFSDQKQAAQVILAESERLSKLVESLLDLSRLDCHSEDSPLSPILLCEPIEDCLDRVSPLAIQKGVALSLIAPEPLLLALGEEELITQVVGNLLSNAVRYAKSSVSVTIAPRDSSVTVTVLDDGPGLSPRDQKHLFDRCYKGTGGHFGFGLAIAQAATQALGGTLTAQNAPEGGAVFTLALSRPT